MNGTNWICTDIFRSRLLTLLSVDTCCNILSLKPSGNHGWLDTNKNFSDKKKWGQHTRPQTCCRFQDASNSNANSWLKMLHEIQRCTCTMNNVPCLNMLFQTAQWISQHREMPTSTQKRLNRKPTAAPPCDLHTFHHLLTQRRCTSNSILKFLEIFMFCDRGKRLHTKSQNSM